MRTAVVLLLVLAAGIGTGLLIARGGGGDKPAREATVGAEAAKPFESGDPLTEPPVVTSENGTLKVTLVAETGTVPVSGVPVAGMQTYAAQGAAGDTDRGFLGPTLQVEPGDWIEITLDNQLTVPEVVNTAPGADNCPDSGTEHAHGEGGGEPGEPQLTNLHFHGLHVTPRRSKPYGDNVLLNLGQGKSKFRFRIPADHSQGTYWYHAHRHGCTDEQVFRGLAGMLLIGDSREALPERFAGIRTRILALKDIQVEQPKGSTGWQIPAAHSETNQTHRTVNGLVTPRLDIRPGETQLWRLANVSSNIWYRVALGRGDGDRRHDRLTVVAQDGNSLLRPHRATTLVLPPGRRLDVLVRGPKSGRRVLETLRFDQGRAVYGRATLAHIEVRGRPAPSLGEPERLAPPPQEFPPARGPDRRFTFDLDVLGAHGFEATINNALFDPEIPDAAPRLNTTERWVLLNKSSEWHPFHIHQDDFRVVSSSDDSIPNLPGVQDIVSLPPGTPAKPSRVVIEMPYTDFSGQFVFHCHILDHEDAGMMSLVDLSS